jgi:uncharacterized protein
LHLEHVPKMDTIAPNMSAITQTDVGARLFGRTRQAVMGLLLLRPDEQFHLRQVVRLAGVGMGAVQRELGTLVAMGLICREQSGRQVYFQADQGSPVFKELQGLILKTSGMAGILRAAMGPVAKRVRAAAIFGSTARGTMRQGSDVDLLVVSEDLSMRELAGPIREASSRLGREVNMNLYKPREWVQRCQAGHPLAKSIMSAPRIMVIGGEDELERMAEERVGEAESAGRGGDRASVPGGGSRPARRK